MNYKVSQIFVPDSVSTSAATSALGKQDLGIYNPSTFANIGGTTADADFLVAIGSGVSKYGSFKTSAIKLTNIISTSKTVADTSVKQQITYIGFDEVNDGKTPTFACDEEYVVTFKIDEYWSKGIFQPMIQESVRVKTTACSECGGGCDSLGCSVFMSDLADKINANPLLSKYLTATYVYKGSLPTYKWTLTIQDPGDSTAETALLTTLRSVYASYVATPSSDIVITSDTDGDSDADSLGNTMFELTPLSTVTSLPDYNGVAWAKVLVSAGSVTACGVKVTGNTLDEFGNACVPDAVPYVFNLVRFKVAVHEGPYNTQDFDIENFVSPWSITTTQNIKYPLGDGKAMAELERHYYRNNLPAGIDAPYYWNPIYNEAVNQYLYVDKTKTYDMYEIVYMEPSPVGFEKKTQNVHSVIILADSTVTSAVTTALNNVLPTSFHV